MKKNHGLFVAMVLALGSFVFCGLTIMTIMDYQNKSKKSENEPLINSIKNSTTVVISEVSEVVSNTVSTVQLKSNRTNGESPDLVKSARQQIGVTTNYDPAYVGLKFPMGDVPIKTGVCTDVVIRAYRKQGKDLQVLVNKDMKQAWTKYPKIWGAKGTDKNIDHRRVPNLQTFFSRHGKKLVVTKEPINYQAGDLVTWKVSGRPHIGIVSNKTTYQGVPLIIHNIGRGTQENNILFDYPITGHYRY